jgi:oligopeptidase A
MRIIRLGNGTDNYSDAGGERYRETILERGGSQPMIENFQDFVGRAPQIDALLRQRGVAAAN